MIPGNVILGVDILFLRLVVYSKQYFKKVVRFILSAFCLSTRRWPLADVYLKLYRESTAWTASGETSPDISIFDCMWVSHWTSCFSRMWLYRELHATRQASGDHFLVGI